MEIRVVVRGALAGFIAGVLGFVFARIWAEPVINKAIAYEAGRDDILAKLNKAAGRAVAPDGPEIFSRHVQSTVGLATGIIAFSTAMGALIGVAYVLLHGRFRIRVRHLVWLITAFGFLGVYLLPFVKYPANPPAIGHSFTIDVRGRLYLTMVVSSLVLLALAAVLARKLSSHVGVLPAVLLSAVAFFAVYGTLIGLLPSLGDLPANVALTSQFGYARSATETPQAITNSLATPLMIDGRSVAPGQILYPGFDADVLWKFRWYSMINQVLVWATLGIVLGELLERYFYRRPGARSVLTSAPETIGAS